MGMLLSKKSNSLCDLKILVGTSIPISPPLILNETSSSIDTKANCLLSRSAQSARLVHAERALRKDSRNINPHHLGGKPEVQGHLSSQCQTPVRTPGFPRLSSFLSTYELSTRLLSLLNSSVETSHSFNFFLIRTNKNVFN